MHLYLFYLSASHMARLFLRRGTFARFYGPDALLGTNCQNGAHWASPFQLPQQLLKGKRCHFLLYRLSDSDSGTSVYYKYAKPGRIDDERQFKMAKRPQAPSNATVRKRFFHDDFVIFCRRSKRITFLESVNFSTCVCMQIFNFRDGHLSSPPL